MSNKNRDQKVVTEASTSDESIMVGDVIRVRADDGGTEYALRHLANSLWTDGEPSSLTDVGGMLLFTNNGALGYMLAVALNDPRVPITARLAGLTVEEILHTFVQNGSTRVVFFAANILHCLAPQTQAAMLQAGGVPCMAELVDAFGEAAGQSAYILLLDAIAAGATSSCDVIHVLVKSEAFQDDLRVVTSVLESHGLAPRAA